MPPIEPLSQVQKGHIRQVLAHAKGDMSLACRILGIPLQDLQRLLITHGLQPDPPAAVAPSTPDKE